MIVRTFDNRVNAETGDKKHECHHHNSHAYGTIHPDVEDCECGSMAEPMDQEPNHCRFEFPSDIYKKFIQTHDSRMCKSKITFNYYISLAVFNFFEKWLKLCFQTFTIIARIAPDINGKNTAMSWRRVQTAMMSKNTSPAIVSCPFPSNSETVPTKEDGEVNEPFLSSHR